MPSSTRTKSITAKRTRIANGSKPAPIGSRAATMRSPTTRRSIAVDPQRATRSTAHSQAIRRAQQIALMAFDVDGVLTDGSLHFSAQGDAMKTFFSRDGQGLRFLQHCGVRLAIITGRRSGAVVERAKDLGITLVLQGITNKKEALVGLATDYRLSTEQCGYMGDDVVDIAIMNACGFSAAPADAAVQVLQQAHFVSQYPGGRGAVREVCEFILMAQNRWASLLEHYTPHS